MTTVDSLRVSLAREVDGLLDPAASVQELRPDLGVFRMREPIPPMSGVMAPAICFILQGGKRVHFDGQTQTYEAGQFLVSTLAVPVKGEVVVASPEEPLVGIAWTLDVQHVARLVAEVGPEALPRSGAPPSAVSVHELDADMLRTLERLVGATGSDLSWRILGEGLQRELLFRVLQHPGAGWQLTRRLRDEDGLEQVARAVAFIENHLTEPLDVERISRKAGLSPSRLHARFRKITSRSPMQYVKYLRLHRAHALLLSGAPVTDAAYAVGYMSPSQFSREFRRQFGHPPSAARPHSFQAVQPAVA